VESVATSARATLCVIKEIAYARLDLINVKIPASISRQTTRTVANVELFALLTRHVLMGNVSVTVLSVPVKDLVSISNLTLRTVANVEHPVQLTNHAPKEIAYVTLL